MPYAERPPLTRRQQETPWGEDGAGAVGRLLERIECLERDRHQQQQTIRRLRDALAGAEHRERLLLERLARKRSNRRRPNPAQLPLAFGNG